MASVSLDILLEAVLFTAAEPQTVAQLAKTLDATPEAIEKGLNALHQRLTHGIRLAKTQTSYQLVSAPKASAVIGRFLKNSSRQELSKPALETLAIIAYRGPITKIGIEKIRGVSSDTMIRNLLSRALIIEASRSTEPGRPQQYSVSHEFLQHFGLTSTSELPPLTDPAA